MRMENQENKYYQSAIDYFEIITDISISEIGNRFQILEGKFKKEEVDKRRSNCVYEYENSLHIGSDRILRELKSSERSTQERIIRDLSNIHSHHGRAKLQNDTKLVSEILKLNYPKIRGHQIELIGRINLFEQIGFLEQTIQSKNSNNFPRAVYHYGSLTFKNEIQPDKNTVDLIINEIGNYSDTNLSTIISGLELLCRNQNKQINESIINFLSKHINNKKYLDPTKHLSSSINPGWPFVNIIHKYSTAKNLATIYQLYDLGVDQSNSLRAIAKLKKENAINEVLSIAEKNYDIARYPLLDLAKITKDHELFYLITKFIQESKNIEYELNLIGNEMRELVSPELLDYLKSKPIKQELRAKLDKALKIKSISKDEFILDLKELTGNKIEDVEGKTNWDNFLKHLYDYSKLTIKMSIESEKDVFEFNDSLKAQLNANNIEYIFDYKESNNTFQYFCSLMNSYPTKIEISGDKRWVLNDPSFYVYYINQKLNEKMKNKMFVQIPPFETHIFMFGDKEIINSKVNKYN